MLFAIIGLVYLLIAIASLWFVWARFPPKKPGGVTSVLVFGALWPLLIVIPVLMLLKGAISPSAEMAQKHMLLLRMVLTNVNYNPKLQELLMKIVTESAELNIWPPGVSKQEAGDLYDEAFETLHRFVAAVKANTAATSGRVQL